MRTCLPGLGGSSENVLQHGYAWLSKPDGTRLQLYDAFIKGWLTSRSQSASIPDWHLQQPVRQGTSRCIRGGGSGAGRPRPREIYRSWIQNLGP